MGSREISLPLKSWHQNLGKLPRDTTTLDRASSNPLLGLRAPSVFAGHYANAILVVAAEAWLGPHFHVTSQVNVVRPGGEAKQAHRDHHLGFQTVTS
jgi:ectoine hydroxylase-related dioxygenase (phytanoyl-CoA dioxygenase family)